MPLSGLCFTFRRGRLNVATNLVGKLTTARQTPTEGFDESIVALTAFGLWQQRYFSCPLSESHHWVGLRYVEQNPCRACMVNKPEDYRWSSAGAHLGEGRDRSGLLDLEYWNKAGGAQTWREMHTATESADQVQLLRRCTYAGRPYGEEDFVTRIEEQFQRSWRRWGFEKLAASA